MNRIKFFKGITVVLSIVLLVGTCGRTAFAAGSSMDATQFAQSANTTLTQPRQTGGVQWYQLDGGNPVRKGGINQLDGVECQSIEETEALEERLKKENYILVTTDDKEISDEDFELLRNGYPPYSQYFQKDSEFGWDMKMYKVYMYIPSYNDAMKQLRAGKTVRSVTRAELSTSTVLIDYASWYFMERVGKTVNEFNDNIPSWCTSTGFLQINSPIDVMITLDCWQEHTFNVFYVRANEPFLVKLKMSMYVVRSVNTLENISLEEEALNLNRFVVNVENTEDDPRILNLENLVEKYDIKPIDISDKPDFSWDNRDNIDIGDIGQESLPIESVEVWDEEEQPDDNTMFWKLLFSVLWITVALAVVIAVIVVKRKNQR